MESRDDCPIGSEGVTMTPQWTIGPRAQKRLLEMERAGWNWQQLTGDTEGMVHRHP